MVKISKIKKISGREILDSRGNPTIEVELVTDLGKFLASVPSGVSRGKHEAVELRDGGRRYQGKGVLKAVNNVNKIIAPKLKGKDPTKQREIDELLIKLNGTKNKSRLGANAILPVSIAVCRAGAKQQKLFLWQWISQIAKTKPRLPETSVLMAEGGLHGKGGCDIQEFMVADSFAKAKRIYQNLKKYKFKTGLEGGFIVPTKDPEEILDLILKMTKTDRIKIILDIAASHETNKKTPGYYLNLAKQYPIFGIEDPFSQDDWKSWQKLNKKLLLIGDDLTATNPKRIKIARQKRACSAVIIKPNQIGTVSETIEAAKLAKSFGWKIIVSHRSGETMDDFIADLAVGIGAEFIKSGAPFPKERMTKYNRLVKIEGEIHG